MRLIFLALDALKREMRIAGAIDPRPAGSTEDVKVRVWHARRDRLRAFSVRDRDFLERAQVDDMRRKAVHADSKTAEPWPLSRHAIESYLLDPRFLTQALPSRTEAQWKALLDPMAETRRWTDLLRATLVDLGWRVSRIEWPGTDAHLTSRGEALAGLSTGSRSTPSVGSSASRRGSRSSDRAFP